MGEVKVLLVDWEHQCCGDIRKIGDTVSMSVFESNGVLFESRHDCGDRLVEHALTGRVVGIAWRPAVLRQLTGVMWSVDGYGAPVSIGSTDERPEGDSWALEFTVEPVDL